MEEEAVDYAEMRNKVHSALTEIVGQEETEDTLLSGWTLIFEGIHQNNKRSLTFLTSDATGDTPLTPWVARGYMIHAQDFISYDDSDDEED